MNFTLLHLLYLVLAYLIGAIPWGWMIVWLVKRKDVRYMASGRSGMSNVIRAAGKGWGILTAVLDILKGFAAIYVARLLIAEPEPWLTAVGGILAVLGHIYSVYMIEKRRDGKFYFRGGAGGLTSIGAGTALWAGYLIFVPLPCFLIYMISGYASVATASFNIFGTIGFIVGAIMGKCSWWCVLYGVGAEILVLISLRPNFKRLRRGDERKHEFRIGRKEDKEKKE